MSAQRSLKSRIVEGEEIKVTRIPMDSSAAQVQEIIRKEECDLIYIDSQHGAHTEWDIVRICEAAEELDVGVQLRIKHTRQAYLIGNYLDLGLLGIKVPEVEEEATVLEAVNAFYFPPVGRRSWGGNVGFGKRAISDRLEYAQWWNEHGILGIKIESVKAVLNVRALAHPLVTYLDFGGQDLRFSLETVQHPHLKSVEDCRAFVKQELVGSHVQML